MARHHKLLRAGVVANNDATLGELRERLAARRGDVVVLDNLTAHRASRIGEVAAERGAQVLWLAPCSPDFSPIEQCRSKIKAYLRGVKARTEDELDKALAQAIGLVTKADTLT